MFVDYDDEPVPSEPRAASSEGRRLVDPPERPQVRNKIERRFATGTVKNMLSAYN